MKPSEFHEHIPAEKFRLVQTDKRLHDAEFKTEPVGYLKDAWRRFRRNRSSVVAMWIIIVIVLASLILPLFASHSLNYSDNIYIKKLPKHDTLAKIGICTGIKTVSYNERGLTYIAGIGVGAEDTLGQGVSINTGLNSFYSPVKSIGMPYTASGKEMRDCDVDVYLLTGFTYMQVTQEEYEHMCAWQEENGLQLIYPMVDTSSDYCPDPSDANYWFRAKPNGTPVDEKGRTISIIEGADLVDNYVRDAEGNVQYYVVRGTNMRYIRVLYYNYYQYLNGETPQFLLGTDGQGYDIAVRMAAGIRVSLVLAIFVSLINLSFGTAYGAIEGYYGGVADMVMERITDILSNMPTIVVATLCNLYFVATGKMSSFGALLLTFCVAGWLGTAYRVRTQFYRYRGQEYVLAARTLGARDFRLMFHHIFPNALGTIITSSVLVIPGVIYSESSLSYLGIINLNGPNSTSLGTLLANGSEYLYSAPHIILWPCIIISLLMISFNLFGNGLRDAFNPSLRGSEEG